MKSSIAHIETEHVPLEKAHQILKEKYEKLKAERDELARQLKEFKRMIFGAKSERFIATMEGQLSMFDEELKQQAEEIEEQTITYTKKKKKKKEKPVRKVLPAHLPRVEEIIEPENIPEGAVRIGEEVTELLEIKPMTVFVRRIIRPKYVLPEEKGITIAKLPSLPLPKSNASASLLAFILISKFVDHLPLYRLLQIFKRQDLVISKSTIGNWVSNSSNLLRLLYESFKEKFMEDASYIQADESPIKVQDRAKKKSTHQGYMWVLRKPEEKIVLFEYNKGRGKEFPEKALKNFTGTLQTDGYAVYKTLTTKGEITLLGCMAHARRYFEKALDNDKQRAEKVLTIIQELYQIERELKENEAEVDEIYRIRQEKSLPTLLELEIYLKKQRDNVLPKSSIGRAISYTLSIFENLKTYVKDGRYEIDNNNIENAIRPLAIGRKNYLFAGSHQAAQNIAMFYTFFANCKIHGVNPYQWMSDVLDRIQEHKGPELHELFPQNWKPKS